MSMVTEASLASYPTSSSSAPGAATQSTGWSAERANRVRWIWFGATLALAIALVVGSYLNYRGVANAALTLNHGQAEFLQLAERETFRFDQPFTAARVDSFVRAQGPEGMRYFAILDSSRHTILSAGSPSSETSDLDSSTPGFIFTHPLMTVGDRIRIFHMRPPLVERVWGPNATRAWFGAGGRPGMSAPFFEVMEFTPVAPKLLARARRALILAWVGAAILTFATLLFWRTSLRYETIRVRLEEQRRLALLGEMSAVLAHEIRNPLASLKGHAQLLAERLSEGSPDKRKADRVVDEATRLEVLTTDLLEFARSGPMDFKRVDPAALLRSCVAELPPGTVTIDTTKAPDSWFIDERRFCYAVLANLLRNAIQASPPGRPTEARAALEKDALVFTIRDHGAGLPAGQESRVFDPFFTTRTTGTGLGLALARRVVELHGGRITAQNGDDGGALFRVELPPQAR